MCIGYNLEYGQDMSHIMAHNLPYFKCALCPSIYMVYHHAEDCKGFEESLNKCCLQCIVCNYRTVLDVVILIALLKISNLQCVTFN